MATIRCRKIRLAESFIEAVDNNTEETGRKIRLTFRCRHNKSVHFERQFNRDDRVTRILDFVESSPLTPPFVTVSVALSFPKRVLERTLHPSCVDMATDKICIDEQTRRAQNQTLEDCGIVTDEACWIHFAML